MTFVCDHLGFTRAANHPTSGYIGRGNVWSDVQTSGYVRAHTQTTCNGMTFPQGHLRNTDLDLFKPNVPRRVLLHVCAYTQRSRAILYHFFHFQGRDKVEHGWIATDDAHRLLGQWITGPTWKSGAVIDACRRHLEITLTASAA